MATAIGTMIGMLAPFLLLGLIFSSGLAVIFKHLVRPNKHIKTAYTHDQEVMPCELRDGRLFMSEKDIATSKPRAMHGRVDQVYEYRGDLCVVDTKVRTVEKVYESDIVQLSVYKTILENSERKNVLPYGYIRLVCYGIKGRYVKYKRVLLFTEQQISELWDLHKRYA